MRETPLKPKGRGLPPPIPADLPPTPWVQAVAHSIVRIAIVLMIALLATALMRWVKMAAETGEASFGMLGILALVLIAYALLIAVPFVPGIEIGLTLMILNGAGIVPVVYLATIAGLGLAFAVGRWMPYAWLYRMFHDLRLKRACKLLEDVAPLPPDRRLALFRNALPGRLGPVFIRYRYLALALLINLPGNALIGGGGGILMVAGLSRLFSVPATLITICLAVLPAPLAFWLWGADALAEFEFWQ